jgi:hypothetical protein
MVYADEEKLIFILRFLLFRAIEDAFPGSKVFVNFAIKKSKANEKMRVRSQLYEGFGLSDLNMNCGTHDIDFTITIVNTGRGTATNLDENAYINLKRMENFILPKKEDLGFMMTICLEHIKQMGCKLSM